MDTINTKIGEWSNYLGFTLCSINLILKVCIFKSATRN